MISYLRYLFSISLFLFISFPIFAQNVDELSDQEIQNLIKQAEQSGMTEEQLAAAAAAKGFTPSDLVKFRERVQKMQSDKRMVGVKNSTKERGVDSTEINAENNKKPNLEESEKKYKRSKIFGLNIFDNNSLNFEPNLNIPTPRNYILGTNDELSIDITGYAYAHYDAKVNPDGNIKIENLNPIFVAGQTIEQAKVKIVQRLKSLFGGLGSGGLNADVTLSKIRSIKVMVIGEAVFPGTYTIPSLATAFNVLYAAGGPTEIGSLRNIEIFRKGKKIKTLDLYDFLLRGDSSDDIGLNDQDVIMIPYVEKRIVINGSVRNPKIFEIKNTETLQTALSYAGGFNENAYTKTIRLERVTETEKKILTVYNENIKTFPLQKGDVVFVDSLSEKFENLVTVEGAVFRPGDFELAKASSLLKLLNLAEGIKPEAFTQRVIIYREKENAEPEVISVDLRQLIEKKTDDVLLQKNDKVIIKSNSELQENRTIQIDGEINKPSMIPFTENLDVSEAVFLAGGFKEGANAKRIEIARRIKADGGDSEQNVQIIKIDIDARLGILENDKKIVLHPFDRIYVRKLSQYEPQKTVSINGEIFYPGPYTLNDKKERISDLIEKAGGIKGQADIGSAKFTRNGVQMGLNLKEVFTNKNSTQNLLLITGDILEIPRKKETVTISGNVYNPVTVPFDPSLSLKDYLSLAGGTTDSAHVKKIYVKYGNGRLNRTKHFAGIKTFPKIENGSEIIVPVYRKQRWTSAERIAVSSAVVSISTVLISIVLRIFPSSSGTSN